MLSDKPFVHRLAARENLRTEAVLRPDVTADLLWRANMLLDALHGEFGTTSRQNVADWKRDLHQLIRGR